MGYYGSWKIDDALTFTVNTHTPSTGAATDADAVPTYRVYEDETATPILTGSMALLDSANTAGFYSEQITLSSANGFEKGKSYNIYVTATVGSIEGTISHNFQMEAEVDANIVSDKTGYALTQAFPTNFSDLSIEVTTGRIDLAKWIGSVPDALSSGKVAADLKLWLAAAPSALNSGAVQADVQRWLNAVVNALSSGNVPADLKLWLTVAPLALAAQRVVSDLGAINGVSAAAVRLALAAGTIVPGTVDITGFTPTTTEFEADDITVAGADHFNGRKLIFTDPALQDQATEITDYVLTGGRGHFTVVALSVAPSDNDTFVIV